MSTTLSIRLGEELSLWMEEQARKTGRSQGSIVKEALEKSRHSGQDKPFMLLAGCLDGPKNLSQRKGFSKS